MPHNAHIRPKTIKEILWDAFNVVILSIVCTAPLGIGFYYNPEPSADDVNKRRAEQGKIKDKYSESDLDWYRIEEG